MKRIKNIPENISTKLENIGLCNIDEIKIKKSWEYIHKYRIVVSLHNGMQIDILDQIEYEDVENEHEKINNYFKSEMEMVLDSY